MTATAPAPPMRPATGLSTAAKSALPASPGVREARERPSPLVMELQAIAGPEHVLWRYDELRAYSYDGSIDTGLPDAVVLPGCRDEVVEIVKLARRSGRPIVPRGAGTGLSGGAIPIE